jgi:hypothetical protein
LLDNFGDRLRQAADHKKYSVSNLCGIVCQETAYKWVKWLNSQDVQAIVARSVFDASGDYPGTTRTAFPVNTAAFRARYGDALTAMLIEEANITRRMQGWGDEQWVYKGYGLFQYDLQKIVDDPDFFTKKRWYDFDACLEKCCDELDEKLSMTRDLWKGIAAYNGSGARAQRYAQNVKVFSQYCSELTGD